MKVAFVDPVVSPAYLGEQLALCGFTTCAVYTLNALSDAQKKLRFRPDLFDHHIMVAEHDSMESVAVQLKQWGAERVFYGYEGSVVFADQLAQLVCPEFAHDPASSLQRCNKYAMQEALRIAGLPFIPQIKITGKQLTAEHRAALETFQFPVIVKPVNGSSSLGVKKCESMADLDAWLTREVDHLMIGRDVEEYVIQECVFGEEYLLDTVSIGGTHKLVGLQRYAKTYYQGSPICRFFGNIERSSPEWDVCQDFIFAVLNAVQFREGMAHTEIFMTDAGPRLIEVNPRISGAYGFSNKLHQLNFGFDQVSMLAQSFGLNLAGAFQDNMRADYGRIVCLQNWQPRKMSPFNAALLQQLSSYQEHFVLKQPGTLLNTPQALSDTVAFVLLAHHNQDQLLEDYAQLMVWEEQGGVLF